MVVVIVTNKGTNMKFHKTVWSGVSKWVMVKSQVHIQEQMKKSGLTGKG